MIPAEPPYTTLKLEDMIHGLLECRTSMRTVSRFDVYHIALLREPKELQETEGRLRIASERLLPRNSRTFMYSSFTASSRCGNTSEESCWSQDSLKKQERMYPIAACGCNAEPLDNVAPSPRFKAACRPRRKMVLSSSGYTSLRFAPSTTVFSASTNGSTVASSWKRLFA